MQVVSLLYELSRQHKQIKGFVYGKGYEQGAANEAYPLVWLDDPVYGQSVNKVLRYTVNVDILGIPENEANVLDVQSSAFLVGLSFVEKIREMQAVTGFGVDGFAFLSLRDYYDNNSAGFRFTYTLTQANPINRCGDFFDPQKEFVRAEAMPEFMVEHPGGCVVFNDKTGLPDFKI